MMEELKEDVLLLKKAVFGDPADLKEHPGIISELTILSTSLQRTNEILSQLREDIRRFIWIIVGLGSSAVIAFLFKGHV